MAEQLQAYSDREAARLRDLAKRLDQQGLYVTAQQYRNEAWQLESNLTWLEGIFVKESV